MGKEAHHFPDFDEMHIDQVTFQSRNDTGQRLNAIGNKGVVTGDGERVTLLGDVRAVRESTSNLPRIELRGEKIIALVKDKKILSSDPVWITHGADTFSANSLDFNVDSGQYQLSGRVRGVLAPKATARQP
jgi:lipopolysaccharide export system protein LptC